MADLTTVYGIPTDIAGALPSGAALPSDESGSGISIFGCPVASFLPLETECSRFTTDAPACATATPQAQWDAACCGSLSAFGSSAASCFIGHAPGCLNTSEILATIAQITGIAGVSGPCGKFGSMSQTGSITVSVTTSGTGITTDTGSPSATGKSEASSGAAGESSGKSTAASGGSGGSGGSSATGSVASGSASASATKSGAGVKNTVEAGLKVYLGVGLVGILAVLAM